MPPSWMKGMFERVAEDNDRRGEYKIYLMNKRSLGNNLAVCIYTSLSQEVISHA
jgi:hypothetical protein